MCRWERHLDLHIFNADNRKLFFFCIPVDETLPWEKKAKKKKTIASCSKELVECHRVGNEVLHVYMSRCGLTGIKPDGLKDWKVNGCPKGLSHSPRSHKKTRHPLSCQGKVGHHGGPSYNQIKNTWIHSWESYFLQAFGVKRKSDFRYSCEKGHHTWMRRQPELPVWEEAEGWSLWVNILGPHLVGMKGSFLSQNVSWMVRRAQKVRLR